MIITIAGKPGSGKSSLGRELQRLLGFKRYYIGGMYRKIAEDLGISLEELEKRDEKEFFADKIVDEKIVQLAKEKDNIIIEGRTAFHFVPRSIKIFLDVDLHVGTRRILKESLAGNRPTENYGSEEELYKSVVRRYHSDQQRYMKYYGFDCYDTSKFDIVINTSNQTLPEVLEKVLNELKKHNVLR